MAFTVKLAAGSDMVCTGLTWRWLNLKTLRLQRYRSSEIDPELESKSDVEFHISIADVADNFTLTQVMRGLFDALHFTASHKLERIREIPADHLMQK